MRPLLLLLLALALPATAAPTKVQANPQAQSQPKSPAPATLTLGYVDLADDPRYDADRLHARNLALPEGRPLPAVDVALREARYVTQALGVTLALERATVPDAQDAAGLLAAVNRLEQQGARMILADLPAAALAKLAAATRGRELLLFNVAAADDALRQTQCEKHLLHTLPSHAMQADALAQVLVARKWRNVLMLVGPQPEDALQAAAFERAARRFGLKVVEKRPFLLSNDPRQRDLGNVALLTGGPDYDVIHIADADGEFARSVPYRSVRPRPVVGAEGLAALAWHWSWERHGAPQLNARFEKQAEGRRMGSTDWAAWLAVKSVVEALQRTGKADFRTLAAYLRSPDITLDGFKGHRLSFRPWDNQLRQPLLVASHNAVVERAPIEGFLHQSNTLDTLGADQADSRCKMP